MGSRDRGSRDRGSRDRGSRDRGSATGVPLHSFVLELLKSGAYSDGCSPFDECNAPVCIAYVHQRMSDVRIGRLEAVAGADMRSLQVPRE